MIIKTEIWREINQNQRIAKFLTIEEREDGSVQFLYLGGERHTHWHQHVQRNVWNNAHTCHPQTTTPTAQLHFFPFPNFCDLCSMIVWKSGNSILPFLRPSICFFYFLFIYPSISLVFFPSLRLCFSTLSLSLSLLFPFLPSLLSHFSLSLSLSLSLPFFFCFLSLSLSFSLHLPLSSLSSLVSRFSSLASLCFLSFPISLPLSCSVPLDLSSTSKNPRNALSIPPHSQLWATQPLSQKCLVTLQYTVHEHLPRPSTFSFFSQTCGSQKLN